MKSIVSLLVLVAWVVSINTVSWAADESSTVGSATPTNTNSSTIGSYQAPNSTYTTVGGNGSGAYQQAQNAQNKANNTSQIAMMIAAMAAAACGPHNPAMCALAAAAMAAAMMANQKAQQAQNMKNELGTSGTGQDPDAVNATTGQVTGDLGKLTKDLAKKGYKVDGNGNMTMPNGSTLNADAYTQEGLTAAGFSPSDTDKILSGLDKLKKDIEDSNASMEVASIEGGGATHGFGSTPLPPEEDPEAGLGGDTVGIERDPAAWDGFFKKYGDSSIGVSQSDLFLMVEKRVEKERPSLE